MVAERSANFRVAQHECLHGKLLVKPAFCLRNIEIALYACEADRQNTARSELDPAAIGMIDGYSQRVEKTYRPALGIAGHYTVTVLARSA